MKTSISVFLPAFNEEENIEKAISSANRILKKIAENYEIIVVLYDGSADNTENIVKGIINKNVRLVHQKINDRGYGRALKIGIENSRYDLIFYTDADNQFNIEEIKRFIPLTKDYDIITGYRKKRKDPFMRLFLAKVYNILLKIIFNIKVRDVDSAFKLFKRKIFKKIKVNCRTGLADAEIILKAQKQNFKIKEIPVTHYPRLKGQTAFGGNLGSIVSYKTVFGVIREMERLWKELH